VKFKVGDIIRVKGNTRNGEIVDMGYDPVNDDFFYEVRWEDAGILKPMLYYADEVNTIWEYAPVSKVTKLAAGCVHEWVNVGFTHAKFVCKKCNVDQNS
jgi:hypothetical protein